ncbi:MAG TPA: DUF4260 family protein [Gaiellaceae bacterium]|jgi:hypothetical protein|nr:DUF4260 family protein [Gaiellaceae bacterium]
MQTTLAHPLRRWRRPAYALLAVTLLAAVVAAVVDGRADWWVAVAFGLGPDVALFVGAGRGLEKGRLHPRAVPLYNLLHRFWGPVVLAAVAAAGLVSSAFLVGALAWAFHIALDRSVGYGLRTRDGFQRP